MKIQTVLFWTFRYNLQLFLHFMPAPTETFVAPWYQIFQYPRHTRHPPLSKTNYFHDGIERLQWNFGKQITQHRNCKPMIFSWPISWNNMSVDTHFVPWLPASWTSVTPASKFLHHLCTLLSLIRVGSYTLPFVDEFQLYYTL